jgi:anti-sigma regulatory factor (Ser/Thr protein kinase)
LREIKQSTGIFDGLPPNVINIFEYSFLEMVNNAIEHSCSKKIKIKIKREKEDMFFSVEDSGVGIFENIKNKFKLPDILSAVQGLLKGKKTTDPSRHSGQGVFFTSKLADNFTIKSSNKVLIFNNITNDLFIEDRATTHGTRVVFMINLNTKKTTREIFSAYTDKEYEFSKTQIKIKMFKVGKNILSRSEARRVVAGLEDFKEIILDFKNVESIGQAFADEIFRIWKNNHPDIKIVYLNANENTEFMIKRANA